MSTENNINSYIQKEPVLVSPSGGGGGCILAIESSCDETSASICVDGKILSNSIANQTVHEQFGGVVPELASRAHMQHIVPVVDAALSSVIYRCYCFYTGSRLNWLPVGRYTVCQISFAGVR